MRFCAFFLGLALCFSLTACTPDLGTCDIDAAKTLVYSDDAEGLPAYAGQALVDASCGNGAFCHSAYAKGAARYGAPFGLDFDVAVATDAAETEILARGQRAVVGDRDDIYREVHRGLMPPGALGAEIVAASRSYGLPAIDSDEGLRILRNWLACGAPVVQGTPEQLYVPGTTELRPGIAQIGDIVDPQSSLGCGTGLVSCDGTCVDLASDALHCGACDTACGQGTVCYAGGCLAGGCPAPTTECSGSCVDTTTDIYNCGGCGEACLAGASCSDGLCACSGGTTLCGTDCVDLSTSAANCGSCGTACLGGDLCANGTCQTLSFKDDIQPIFTRSCTSSVCHSGARPAASLSLVAGEAYAELVGVSSAATGCAGVLVTPSSVPDSYLINKLTGIGMCRGNQMPKAGTSLAAAELDAIRAWITAGAPNN